MVERRTSRLGTVYVSGNAMDTDFLFATPSLWSGMARMLDIYGQFDSYNASETEETADAKALYSDFRMIGQDLKHAIESLSTDKDAPVDHRQLTFAFLDLANPVSDAGQ
jgi:hypothetical protein